MDIKKLQNELKQFASERGWEKFHSPKNLVMALSVETAELVECFQWLTESESVDFRKHITEEAVADEIADVLLYLLKIADVTGIDIERAVTNKLRKNALKYPKP